MKITTSSSIISWQIHGETMKAMTDFISRAPKSLQIVTAAVKKLKNIIIKALGPWKNRYEKIDSILKSRDITLPAKVCRVKAMVFTEVVSRCESWTIKKAENLRIDAFELCWTRLLRIPQTARRSNQSILKEISSEYSLE